MNTPQNPHQLHQRYLNTAHLNTAHLSKTYLQLEGFIGMQTEAGMEEIPRKVTIENSSQLSEDTWKDMLITLGVMLVLLVGSSVVLGMGASKLAEGLQLLTKHVNHQQVEHLRAPSSW